MSAPSFATDIRGLFRPSDVEAMKPTGLDLSSYENVKSRARDIYRRLADGDMPCDQPWSPAALGTFKAWMDGGLLP